MRLRPKDEIVGMDVVTDPKQKLPRILSVSRTGRAGAFFDAVGHFRPYAPSSGSSVQLMSRQPEGTKPRACLPFTVVST